MPKVHSRAVSTLLFGLLGLGWTLASFAADKTDTPTKDDSESVFGLTRVWKIHLHVSAANWQAMQPPAGGFPGFGPPPPGGGFPGGPPAAGGRPNPGTERKPGDSPPGPGGAFRPGSFGFDFDYVKADVELDGETLREVGLRFKGNGSYMLSAATRKRPFKIDFNRFVDGQKFHGMQQLNLHNNVMDPTHVRQALSYPVFQAAGIASPRTAFAEVSLTIDGECDREPLGVYTLVEEIDKAFLRRHFQTDKGMLLKPEGTQGLEYKGEDWAAYSWFEPKSKPKKGEAQRLIDLTRLIHKADDEQFRREIGSLLDTDQFASFLAANTLLANMDSFLTQVHNYYVYLPPKSNKFVFLPWDMDLSMGAFFMAGSAEQLQDLSISHPHVGENKLIERLLAWDEFNKTYREHLRRLTEDCFGENGQTTKSLPVVQAALKELIAQETKRTAEAQKARGPGGFGPGFGPGPGPGMFGGQPPLETFFAKRRESITAQLAGKSKGRAPGMSFGPPGGGGPGGGGFGPGNFHAPQILAAADADKDDKLTQREFLELSAKWLRKWDKDKNDSLNEEELKSGLNDALGPPPNAAPGGFKPPTGFGPGMFLGPPLLKVADADKDQKVSKNEWSAQFTGWFKQWDKENDDRLDNTELIAGLNAAFGPPPGQGPPGFGPPRAPDDKPNETSRSDRAAPTPPVELTTQEDHKRLLELLGIKELRRGANGNDRNAPNAANYDESKVHQDLKLPDPLLLKNGEKVTTAEAWKTRRRPEIVEDFDREIYGRVPKVTPSVKWEVTETTEPKVGDTPVVTKKLVGHVDNSAYPLITVDLQLTLTTPADAKGPVPVIMEFGFGGFGGRGFGPPPGSPRGGPTWQEQVIAKGWGYAIIVPNSIQADNGAGLTRGIIGLCNKGQPRKVDDWGSLRAWAWGASRALDYFETDKSVDAKRVGIEGLSRYGKAAIVTLAYDERFAIGFIASSGEGGAKLHRRNFGELVENVASSGEYHWMAGNFLKYAGPLTWDDLPVDSHELVALCAPRPVFISVGSQQVEGGWVDAKGMFLAGVGAGPVYKLLGQPDLGTADFPPQETSLIDGTIAFRQHNGGHTAGPNWPTFLQFAERSLKESSNR